MARTSGKERARARILTDDELRSIWQAAEAATGAPFGPFVQFLLLTGARRSEAAAMARSELSGANWTRSQCVSHPSAAFGANRTSGRHRRMT
jgi:integrase